MGQGVGSGRIAGVGGHGAGPGSTSSDTRAGRHRCGVRVRRALLGNGRIGHDHPGTGNHRGTASGPRYLRAAAQGAGVSGSAGSGAATSG